MEIFVTVIHLLACLTLVLVVLLQAGKGADLAGAFGGGGSSSVLGVRSASQLIHKMTIAAAIFFMITSYSLGMMQSTSSSDSIMNQIQEEVQQDATEAAATPADATEATTDEQPAATEENSVPTEEETPPTENNEQ